MAYECRVEADSVSRAGKRITTFVVTYPRFVHAELMTHRMFSRNSSSSRAIPVEKMIEQVERDPATPVWWGANQKGMQANVELSDEPIRNQFGEFLMASPKERAQRAWLHARDETVLWAKNMLALGLHKQVANRILEPWTWITVIVTATEWANFFALRAPASGPMDPQFPAQPEIQQIAVMMRDAYRASEPVARDHHLPFHRPDIDVDIPTGLLALACVARCARVSYRTHEGERDPDKDIELARKLIASRHWSPFEHVAYASADRRCRSGNFIGWRQFREEADPNFISIRKAMLP